MATQAGVGYSEKSDSQAAGAEAAKAAMAEAGASKANLAIIYHTAKHDPAKFRDGVRTVVGDARLCGGMAAGIITRTALGYDGYQSAVAVVSSDTVNFDVFSEVGLKEHGEKEIGRRLGKKIRSKTYEGEPGLIYMYDSVKNFSAAGFDLNIGTYLVEGMGEGLGTWPPAAGMGMIGNIQFNPTFQFADGNIFQQAAIALVASGKTFRLDTVVMHGCKPASDYHKITKADKNVVLEIDGKPAVDAIAAMLGPDSDKSWEDYPLFITLGVNRGNKFGAYKEEEYANRLCMAIDKERKGLVMFEPDLTPGTEVQLMRRSVDFKYISDRAQILYDSLKGRKPFLAMYIDCLGRAASYCGADAEEGAEIQKVIGSKIPLLGMYTGVELGTVGSQKQQALDWSGVLCVFSE